MRGSSSALACEDAQKVLHGDVIPPVVNLDGLSIAGVRKESSAGALGEKVRR